MNPGSPDAVQAGCSCPPDSNQEGQGVFNTVHADPSKTYFVVEEECPLHGKSNWREKS